MGNNAITHTNVQNKRLVYTIKPRAFVNELLLWVFLFNAVFIPYDNFGLKKISFFLLVILNIDVIINGIKYGKESIAVILMGLILPIFTIILSSILTGDLTGNFLSGYTGMILLVYYIVKKYEIDFLSIYVKITLLLAFFINISALLDMIGIQSVFSNPILSWMYSTSNANIGKSSVYILGYYLFIKTTPMMFITLGVILNKKKYLLSFVVLLALVLSGTRANAVLGIIIFGAAFVIAEKNRARRILIILFVISLVGYVLFGQDLLVKFLAFSSSKNNSDSIRQLTLPSIINTWKKNPVSFIIGQGYTSEFYNAGRMTLASDSELAYWNLLRRVGFIPFILMMYCYFMPIKKVIKYKRTPAIAVGYVAYLVGAYVNPFLYTSTGLTVLLFMYCYAFAEVNKKEYECN